MADAISDEALRKEAQELLDGKAKSLLDKNQLTMRVMRKLLEEKLGLAEGSLDIKKKTIATIVKEALELEPVTGYAETGLGAAKAAAAPREKENRKPGADAGSSLKSGKGRDKQRDAAGAAGRSSERGGARGKITGTSQQGGKRPAREEPSEDGASGSDGGNDDEEGAGQRQKKRAKKARRTSPAPAAAGGGAAGGKGKSVSSRSIEMMKEVCKKATIKIAPTLYIRNKTVLELEDALSELLARHGLNARSGEKEIGQVRRQLERDRDLEGIDTSNIISLGGGRPRRAAAASINFSKMFKQPKVDSDDEEGEEEEEQEERPAPRKRATAKPPKGKAKAGSGDDEGSGSDDESEGASGSEGDSDSAAGPPRWGKPGGKASGGLKAVKGRPAKKGGDEDDSGGGEGDGGSSSSESEDLVDVARGSGKSRGGTAQRRKVAASAGSEEDEETGSGEAEAGRKKGEQARGSCGEIEEELKDEVPKKSARAAKPKTMVAKAAAGTAKARRAAVDDDDKEEEEEEEEEDSASEEDDEREDDDSDFDADEDDD